MPACRQLSISMLVFALCLLVSATSTVTHAEQSDATYVVRFQEYSKVGDRTKEELRAQQTIKRTILKDEQVVFQQEETNSIEIDAVVEVLEVNEQKQETKCRYVIDRAILKTKDGELSILPEGAEFIAQAGEEEDSFTGPEGERLPEIAQRTLPRVISFSAEGSQMDRLFGSDTPRRVGDSWPADKKALVAMAKARGTEALEEDVEGTATLVAAREHDGKTLLDLEFRAHFEISEPTSPVPVADPESAEVTVAQKVTTPASSSDGLLSQTHTITMRQVLRGKTGTPLAGQVMDGTSSETHSATYEKLPAAKEDTP